MWVYYFIPFAVIPVTQLHHHFWSDFFLFLVSLTLHFSPFSCVNRCVVFVCSVKLAHRSCLWCHAKTTRNRSFPHLFIFAVGLLSNVFGLLQLHLLDLHLLLVFCCSVLYDLHSSKRQEGQTTMSSQSETTVCLIIFSILVLALAVTSTYTKLMNVWRFNCVVWNYY